MPYKTIMNTSRHKTPFIGMKDIEVLIDRLDDPNGDPFDVSRQLESLVLSSTQNQQISLKTGEFWKK